MACLEDSRRASATRRLPVRLVRPARSCEAPRERGSAPEPHPQELLIAPDIIGPVGKGSKLR